MLKAGSIHTFKRHFSNVKISEELQQALFEKKPIVSLESTIITHGLPYPENIQMARRVEQCIRNNGAIPATTAFIKGVGKVGLNDVELEMLANNSNATKVSRRDIPYVLAQKLNGGTTISGTMILSEKVGIKVFATGGLGGVHRNGENTMDISADLDELGRTSVAVICAGPKSILDIEKTMEYLETKGVFVGTLGPGGTNIPGFYTRDSSVTSTYNFQDFSTAANIIKQNELFGLKSGMVFCIPPPELFAMDHLFINSIIEEANYDAVKLGIKGKMITPFMLSRIAEATQGASVKTNIEFVLNNAKAATQIAIEYAKLNDSKTIFQPFELTLKEKKGFNKSLVIGSIAMDIACLLKSETVLNDSNPANITTSIGGVGYNVALESAKSGNNVKFVSSVGDDVQGSKIMNDIQILDHSIEIQKGAITSQYNSFHDTKGDLVIAGANMDVIENMSKDHILNEILSTNPVLVLMDANILPDTMEQIIKLSEELKFPIIFEPTSAPKSIRLSEVKNLKRWPECSIDLCTPTIAELMSMYKAFKRNGKLDDESDWICYNIEKDLREAYPGTPLYERITKDGVIKAGVALLPYFKTLLIKDGANGVFLLSCHEISSEILDLNKPTDDKCSAEAVVVSGDLAVLFEHYLAPTVLTNVENVTGGGDALAGSLLTALSSNPQVLSTISRVGVVQEAQKAAADKLSSYKLDK